MFRRVSHLKTYCSICGQYLEESSKDTVLVENKIFGIGLVTSVMNRKRSCGKRGMILISKTMLQIMLSEFSRKKNNKKQQNFQQL